MAHKRKHDDVEGSIMPGTGTLNTSSPSNSGVQIRSSITEPPILGTVAASNTITRSEDDVESSGVNAWQVAESKNARKKKRRRVVEQEPDDTEPNFKFSSPVSAALRVKDLQNLVLYVLADGVAPQWVAVQEAKKVAQVVVIMVPGVDQDFSQSLVDLVSSTAMDCSSIPGCAERSSLDQVHCVAPNHKAQSRDTFHIVPTKAPGDKHTGRFYSPVQTMLISPEPKSKTRSYIRQEAFRPTKTPITNLIHDIEELQIAEFPIHPALFINKEDAQLEVRRREEAGQTFENGWKDSQVDRHTPLISASSDQTQGLRIYAVDCEMVLTTDEKYSLARLSVLDWLGKTVLDRYVKPALPIKDYFTQFSGITPEILEGITARLEDVQKELLRILGPDSVIVGHSLDSDLNALQMTHPFVVDTSLLYPHPRGLPLRSSLKFLANKYLKREIQKGGDGHDSIEDARAALDLVRLKCEMGQQWGVADADGESIFSRLARSGRRGAIVDYGMPERGLGQCASVKIGCQDDDAIAKGIIGVLNESEKVSFTWGRLRDIEIARDWDASKARHAGDDATSLRQANLQIEEANTRTLRRLQSIYEALPPRSVLLVYPGHGDMREVLRLQRMKSQYQREFKVKKWDELTVQWTDNEAQALRKAFEVARQGYAVLGVKSTPELDTPSERPATIG